MIFVKQNTNKDLAIKHLLYKRFKQLFGNGSAINSVEVLDFKSKETLLE